jgi:aspartyl-tRNA synthetase
MSASSLATSLRSHPCGALRLEHVGSTVRIAGWVHRRRDLGGLIFVDLRDRAGLVQVCFDPSSANAEASAAAATLGAETVVLIEGTVTERPAAMRNADMATGDDEVRAISLPHHRGSRFHTGNPGRTRQE